VATPSRLCSYTASAPSKWRVDVYDYTTYFLGFGFHKCPYCDGTSHATGSQDENAVLGNCNTCGFWRIVDLRESGGFHNGREVSATTSVAKEYSVSALDAPIEDLRRYLRSHPMLMAETDPRAFELLVRDCLRSVYMGCEVHHVGSTGDGGVDLKIVQTGQDPRLVQVKRRGDLSRNEGVDVVRSLNGVLFRDGMATGMVVTSAKGFTQAAAGEATVKTRTRRKYRMHLHALPDIIDWLKLPSPEPYEPWRLSAPHWTFDRQLWQSPTKIGYFNF
jgi:Restriction endonuclease